MIEISTPSAFAILASTIVLAFFGAIVFMNYYNSDEGTKEYIDALEVTKEYWHNEYERLAKNNNEVLIKLLRDTIRQERLIDHMMHYGTTGGVIKYLDEDLETELLVRHENGEI